LGRLSDSPTFDELAQRILDATADAVARGDVTADEAAAVRGHLEVRGLIGCGRDIALVDGEPLRSHMPGAETAAQLAGSDGDLCDVLRIMGVQIPLAFAYRTTAPDVDASRLEALTVDIAFARADGRPTGDGELQYQLLVRRDEPVGLEVLTIPFGGQEFQLPIRAAASDLAVEGEPTAVRITPAELALEPGRTYYLNLLALNCPLTTHSVTVRWIVTPEVAAEPGPEASAESGPEGDTDGIEDAGAIQAEGGGCGAAPSTPGAALALLLAGAMRAARRRRSDIAPRL
ncbi:MAG: hypothetical protein IT373_36175, partial [Polyangiaceae bacterium]|nr:hypothetical protein [Polyangiaceae bacterium]